MHVNGRSFCFSIMYELFGNQTILSVYNFSQREQTLVIGNFICCCLWSVMSRGPFDTRTDCIQTSCNKLGLASPVGIQYCSHWDFGQRDLFFLVNVTFSLVIETLKTCAPDFFIGGNDFKQICYYKRLGFWTIYNFIETNNMLSDRSNHL